MADYAVDFDAALREWVFSYNPSDEHYDALDEWATALETNGPPPIVGYAQDGLRIAEGPNGEQVYYDVVAVPVESGPPFGIIGVKQIHPSPLGRA